MMNQSSQITQPPPSPPRVLPPKNAIEVAMHERIQSIVIHFQSSINIKVNEPELKLISQPNTARQTQQINFDSIPFASVPLSQANTKESSDFKPTDIQSIINLKCLDNKVIWIDKCLYLADWWWSGKYIGLDEKSKWAFRWRRFRRRGDRRKFPTRV